MWRFLGSTLETCLGGAAVFCLGTALFLAGYGAGPEGAMPWFVVAGVCGVVFGVSASLFGAWTNVARGWEWDSINAFRRERGEPTLEEQGYERPRWWRL